MPHYLLTHRYGWGTTEEFGQHTLTVFSNSTDQLEVATAARAALDTTSTNVRASWPNVVKYNRVSAARILSLSTGALAAATHVPTAGPNGTSTSAVPPQLSMVVSMHGGGRPNGTPVRGRFYLPPVVTYNGGAVPETAGRIGSGTLNNFTTWVSTWFGSLASAGLEPGVWSRTLAQFGTAANVRIGDVADTVRRRRNQLVEVYSPVVYPIPPVPEP